MTKPFIVLAVSLCLLFFVSGLALAQTTTQVIAVSGDAAPDGNGSFAFFPPIGAAFNDAGQAVFYSFLTGTTGGTDDVSGIFLGNGTTLSQIAREGQNVSNGSFASFFPVPSRSPALNNAGQAAFLASLTGTPGGTSDNLGVFRGNGTTLTEIVRKGQTAPDGNGSFSSLGDPALNDAGQTAFSSSLTGTSENAGIFRGDGTTLAQIARKGQPAPGGGDFNTFIVGPAVNGGGGVAFLGLTNVFGGGRGIYRGDGINPPTVITDKGDLAPDGNGSFNDFGAPVFNDVAQAAFTGSFTGTSGGVSDNVGIFRGDGTSANLVQIVRRGQAAPDGNGSFSLLGDPALNEAGQVAFHSSLTGTSGGFPFVDREGIFRGDGNTLIQIARAGQIVPDGNGSFSSLGKPALNEAGQVAFYSSLTGTSGGFPNDDAAIFLYDDLLGLRQVVRRGDALLGSTITELSISNSVALNGAERSGLNNLGQVAYQFRLLDGRSGVASSGFTSILGDLNADGFVGIDDLNIVLVNWNQNVTPGDLSAGDPTGEGFVGVDDLNVVLVNWNNGTPPTGAAVPEPASLALLSMGVPLMTRRLRRITTD